MITKVIYKQHRYRCEICNHAIPTYNIRIYEFHNHALICFCNENCLKKWNQYRVYGASHEESFTAI